MLAQPLAISPIWTESLALLDEPQGVSCHPLCFRYLHRLGKLSQELRMFIAPFHVLLVSRSLALFRIAVCEAVVVCRGDVTKVAHDVHHFMISEQGHDPSTCLGRLRLQPHQQIQNLARLWAAI